MSSQATGTLTEVASTLVEQLEHPAIMVGLSAEVITTVITVMSEQESSSPVKILAAEPVLKDIRNNFSLASTAADLIERDQLVLRIAEDLPHNQILITETSATAIITAGEAATSLSTMDDDFITTANGYYSSLWQDAEEFLLRTPPISQVRQGLRDEFGEEFGDDFNSALTAVDPFEDDVNFDEVALLLLLAVKHEELLYDISKWGEDTGIASKATFSRTKTDLEDRGVIGTEKVPIDVGRPRLRLKLGSQQLQDAPPAELLSEAH